MGHGLYTVWSSEQKMGTWSMRVARCSGFNAKACTTNASGSACSIQNSEEQWSGIYSHTKLFPDLSSFLLETPGLLVSRTRLRRTGYDKQIISRDSLEPVSLPASPLLVPALDTAPSPMRGFLSLHESRWIQDSIRADKGQFLHLNVVYLRESYLAKLVVFVPTFQGSNRNIALMNRKSTCMLLRS